MTDHTRTEKIGGDSIIIFVVILVVAGNRYDNDPMASKAIDRIVNSWKQTFRVNTGLIGNKVTMEYAV